MSRIQHTHAGYVAMVTVNVAVENVHKSNDKVAMLSSVDGSPIWICFSKASDSQGH